MPKTTIFPNATYDYRSVEAMNREFHYSKSAVCPDAKEPHHVSMSAKSVVCPDANESHHVKLSAKSALCPDAKEPHHVSISAKSVVCPDANESHHVKMSAKSALCPDVSMSAKSAADANESHHVSSSKHVWFPADLTDDSKVPVKRPPVDPVVESNLPIKCHDVFDPVHLDDESNVSQKMPSLPPVHADTKQLKMPKELNFADSRHPSESDCTSSRAIDKLSVFSAQMLPVPPEILIHVRIQCEAFELPGVSEAELDSGAGMSYLLVGR